MAANSFVDTVLPKAHETVLTQADFQTSPNVKLVWEKGQSVDRFLAHIESLKPDEKLVVVVPRASKSRRFIGQLLTLGPTPTKDAFAKRRTFRIGNLTITVDPGRVALGSESLLKAFRTGEPGRTSVMAPPEMSADERAGLTRALLSQLPQRRCQEMVSLVVDEIVPWPMSVRDWSTIDFPVWVSALHNLKGVARQGHRWAVTAVSGETISLERGRWRKELRAADFMQQPDGALLVRERSFRVTVGLSCEARADFSRREGKLKEGQMVFPVKFSEDGSVATKDGGRFRPGFRLFMPILLKWCPAGRGETLIAEAVSGDRHLQTLLGSKVSGRLAILSPEPESVRESVAEFAAIGLAKRRKEGRDTGPGTPPPRKGYLPLLSFWLRFLEQWKRKKQKVALKGKAACLEDTLGGLVTLDSAQDYSPGRIVKKVAGPKRVGPSAELK